MKIILDKSKCIGCGACASLCSKFFELGEDGKSHLKGGKFFPEKEKEELEIEKEECVKEALEACPVEAIELK